MKDVYDIDLNCDLGEGLGNDHELLPFISSCSIACGGHAGDESSMREVIQLALRNKVLIGAHPSYPDKENFGRFSMDISGEELTTSIQKQLSRLTAIIKKENAVLHHIKPHGALYNDLAKDELLSRTFLNAIRDYKTTTALYVPYNSIIEQLALADGFSIKQEAFADRNYNNRGLLVPRKFPNAVITEPKKVLEQLENVVKGEKVISVEGLEIPIKAQTICLHGDTPNALEILMYLSEKLPQINIQIIK